MGTCSYQSLRCLTWQSPNRHHRYLVKKKKKFEQFWLQKLQPSFQDRNIAVIVTETNQSHIGSSSSSRSAHHSAARPGLSLHIYHIFFGGLRPLELRRLDWPSGTYHGRKGHPERRNQKGALIHSVWVGLCLEVFVQSDFFFFFVKATHRIFIRVHYERQLLESLPDLPDWGISGHSQKLVVVLALCEDRLGQREREDQGPQEQPPEGPPTPGGNLAAHRQCFSMTTTHLEDAIRKHVEIRFSVRLPALSQNCNIRIFVSSFGE